MYDRRRRIEWFFEESKGTPGGAASGGVAAVRRWGEQHELGKPRGGPATPAGRKRLRRLLRAAPPAEYRVRG